MLMDVNRAPVMLMRRNSVVLCREWSNVVNNDEANTGKMTLTISLQKFAGVKSSDSFTVKPSD